MAFYRKHKLRNYFMQATPNFKDIVAIKFFDKNLGDGACVTWGRVFKEKELLEIIKSQCLQQKFNDIQSIKHCYSLQEIAEYPYFYERWIYFIQQNIPYKYGYKKWVQTKRQALLEGQDIKFTGFFRTSML